MKLIVSTRNTSSLRPLFLMFCNLQVCKNHLRMLLTTLKSGYNSKVQYKSLIRGYELITVETVQNLIAQMQRRESLEVIQRLFGGRHFHKVFSLRREREQFARNYLIWEVNYFFVSYDFSFHLFLHLKVMLI